MEEKATPSPKTETVNEKGHAVAVRIATLGRLGSFPLASGTVGAAIGLLAAVLLGRLPFGPRENHILFGAAVAAVFFVGVWASGRAEKELQTEDPSSVIIDEVAGQMITFLVNPALSWGWLIAGFLLFRFFDVLKPFPARRAEHLGGGWGIMADDAMAGAYSLLALFLLGFAVR